MIIRPIAWIALSLGLLGCAARADDLRVVTEETAYSYQQNGEVAGSATEVVRATLRRAGLPDDRIAIYPWARAYRLALSEPGVLIYLIARTPEREMLFEWVGEIMRIDYHLYKLRERRDIEVVELDDARQYRIGVLRDDVRHAYLKAHGFTKLVVSAHNSDNFRQLINGQVDLVPMPEHDIRTLCAEQGIDPARLEKVAAPSVPTRLYMAYSRQTDKATVLRTRAAFEHLQAEGVVERTMASEP
ncbi:substrate-binding periplasmic protein [Stutzerimonas urumqiensis]|uniref:substrate-binding periplasmic protein n=1 Tax=Stutzerimonas urumqiensis TaxID=638269 RepID=UPI003BA84C30